MRGAFAWALLAVLAAVALGECDDGPKGPTPDGINEARNTGKPNCNNRVEKMEDPDGTWITAGVKKPAHGPQKVTIPDGKSVDPNKHVMEKPPPPDKEVVIVTDAKGRPSDVTVMRNEDGLPVEPCVYCDTKDAKQRRSAPPAPKGAGNDVLSVVPGVNTATGNDKKKQGAASRPHESPKWYVITDPATNLQRLYSESKLDNTCPNGCSGQGKCVKGVCYCIPGMHCDDCSCKRCKNDCSGKGYCDLHTGVCKCKEGHLTEDCSQFNMFLATNCSGHGSGGPEGECVCNVGFTGVKCEKRSCADGGCNEKNGVCDGGRCYCRNGWRGPSCEVRTCPRQCSQLGTCDSVSGKCNCMPGTYGDDCSRGEPLEPPEPSPCEKKTCGHGTCNVDTGNCDCLAGWFGYDCSQSECTKTDAFGTPLKDCGHANCKITAAGKATCECQPGWKKDADAAKCEKMIDGCPQNCTAAKKQGKCVNAVEKCSCSEGFAGDNCLYPKPRFCSDECSKTCMSLCVLNSKSGASQGGKLNMDEFGNNVHCLESCNGKCFADCMSHGQTEERGKVDAALVHKNHVGEDSDILPAQMARAANGDLKADADSLAGKGAPAVSDTGSLKLGGGKPQKPHVAKDVDVKAAADQMQKNKEHQRNPGRKDPADMANGTPPPEE